MNSLQRHLPLLACQAFALAAFVVMPAMAQVECMNEGKAAAKTYQDSPELTATVNQVRQLQQAGLDPNHYLVESSGGYTLLSMKLHGLAETSAAALESSQSCSESMMRFRRVADVKMIYQHYGLTSILPPSMAKTDYYSVVGGAPMPKDGMMPADTVFGVKPLPVSAEMMKMLRMPYCVFGICS